MTTRARPTNTRRWVLVFLAAIVAILATVFGAATASAAAATTAETRVGASSQTVGVLVEPPQHESPGQRLGNSVAGPGIVVATGVAAKGAAELGDDVVLVRGGTNAVDRFAGGSGVTSDAAGNLSGVSVNSGRTIEEAAEGIRHGQIGTSTVGAVRDAGGTVVRAPTPYNPGHCLISGCSAQTLSDLFTPTMKNPWK